MAFPPLPVELVEYILEIAAEVDQTTSCSLVRVSKAVQEWITPILYHTVILTTPHQLESFHHSLQIGISAYERVRRLFIKNSQDLGYYPGASEVLDYSLIIADIVRGCLGLEVIFIHDKDMMTEVLTMNSEFFPGPWHIILDHMYGILRPCISPRHPLLRNVTHLYVAGPYEPLISIIEALDRVTHLAFGCRGEQERPEFPSWIIRVLSLPSLVMLVLHHDGFNMLGGQAELCSEGFQELAKVEDNRLLVRLCMQEVDFIELLKSGGTIWDDAEVRYKDWRERLQYLEAS